MKEGKYQEGAHHFIYRRLLHFLEARGQRFFDNGQNSPRLQAVRVQGNFVGIHEWIVTVLPILLTFPPSSDMLTDEVRAELLCFIDISETRNAFFPGRIVDRNQSLPVR